MKRYKLNVGKSGDLEVVESKLRQAKKEVCGKLFFYLCSLAPNLKSR